MKCEIDVTDCRDCPMAHQVKETSDSFYVCKHDRAKPGLDSFIAADIHKDFEKIPNWCPLK